MIIMTMMMTNYDDVDLRQELSRDHYVERETYATSRAGIDSMLITSQKRMEDEIENHRGE